MPTPDFQFSIKLAGRDDVDRLLGDVAAQVFRSVGCTSAVADRLVQELNAAIGPGAHVGEAIDVKFHATDGKCEVVVRKDDREIWRTSCPVAQDT